MASQWYCIRTTRNKERWVRQQLECLCETVRLPRYQNDRSMLKVSGYLFVLVPYERINTLRSLPGVAQVMELQDLPLMSF
jgi:transcription antitermination factor NusG